MAYYRVLAASSKYHGNESLTYSGEESIASGSLVEIPLRNQQVLGVVVGKTTKPDFTVKDITRVYSLPPIPQTSLSLMRWLNEYYPAPLGTITNQFLPSSLTKKEVDGMLEPIKTNITELPPLTPEQADVLNKIQKQTDGSFLLHGDTGTGKTRVYLELAAEALAQNKDVLVLTPEIGLTPQLVNDFQNTFQDQVIVWHSNLTPAQRRKAWLHILRSEQPVIVIGPRSALFAPFRQLGLVVVDEAHEQAYKQDQQPRYQSLRVASQLSQLHKARLILGSATPSISEYHFAEVKGVPILRMKKLAVQNDQTKTEIAVVDVKDKNLFGRNYILSDKLLEGIGSALKQKQQSLVFLNRRGTARLVLCQNCGWEQHCPNCDLPLTYHGDNHEVRCHTCGFKAKAPFNCPVCQSVDLVYKSVGTKALVDILAKFFPQASIKRFDSDNTKDEQLAQQYESLASGKVDILVGTQLLTKGLDLPKLSMVGVVSADSALSFPDFTAEERTYQQLRQVVGRVGRGHLASIVVVQTYHPDSPTIQAAVNKDWSSFYATQIKERELYGFPPFYHLLKLTTNRKTVDSARTAADKLKTELAHQGFRVEIIGPSPSFYEKSRLGYQWQLVVKAKQRSQLLEIIKTLPSGWFYDLDPSNLL